MGEGNAETAAAGASITGRGAVRGALVTAVWTLLSRILGFARDALMLAVFGVSAEAGNFVIAWMVPNLFRRLFGEGAVSAAVQPALARTQASAGQAAAGALYARFQGLLVTVLLALVVLGEGVVLFLRDRLPLSAVEDREALLLSAGLLPYVIPICLTALAGAPQQLSGRFTLPALAPAVLNVVWISWLLMIWSDPDIYWLPAGILVGGLLQWIMQMPGVRAGGWPLAPRWDWGDPRLRQALRAFLPAILGLAAIQLNLMVDQILVREIVGEDANTYTYAANRLLQLPMALVGISAATAAMPLFSRLAAERRTSELTTALRQGTEVTLTLMLAAGAGLYLLAGPVIETLFEHRRFQPENTQELTHVLRAYLWSLPAAALLGLLVRARQASGDLRGPARWALAAVPVNIGLDLLLLPRMGVAGAGYATAAALTVQMLALQAGLGRFGIGRPLSWRRLATLAAPALASTLAAGMVLMLGNETLPAWALLLLAVPLGIVAAAVVAHRVLPQASSMVMARLRRR